MIKNNNINTIFEEGAADVDTAFENWQQTHCIKVDDDNRDKER